jgi:hypothetical protein
MSRYILVNIDKLILHHLEESTQHYFGLIKQKISFIVLKEEHKLHIEIDAGHGTI